MSITRPIGHTDEDLEILSRAKSRGRGDSSWAMRIGDRADYVLMRARTENGPMARTFRPVPAMRLAVAFSAELRRALTAEQMGVVIERNRHERDPRVCHSHDLCDANMVMESAWIALGITDDGPDPDDDEHAELWSRSWAMAKRSEFSWE